MHKKLEKKYPISLSIYIPTTPSAWSVKLKKPSYTTEYIFSNSEQLKL